MPALVYARMIRVNLIKKIMSGVDNVMKNGDAISRNQVTRTTERLASGIDLTNNPFDGYQDPKKHPDRARPLWHASKLFNDARVFSTNASSTSIDFVTRLVGRPATISVYQNRFRTFLGTSADDRENAKKVMKQLLGGKHA